MTKYQFTNSWFDYQKPIIEKLFKNIDTNKEYEIEDILNKRSVRRKMQYLVKQKDYPLYNAICKPVKHLDNVRNIVLHFKSIEYQFLRVKKCNNFHTMWLI